jgi:outer membrane protein
MNRFLPLTVMLALAALPAIACAQTPAANRMPDGSRDLYAGLGVQAGPRYAGADSDRLAALPVLQLAWSNGLFVAGTSIGWHLSDAPTVEFGPLIAWQPRRDADGDGDSADAVTTTSISALSFAKRSSRTPYRLAGMDAVPARALGGGFFNYYLNPDWRLTNSVLAGAGDDRNGVLWRVGVQRIGIEFARHHTLSFNAGAEIGNRAWNQAYSGVSLDESARSGYAPYQAGAAVREVHLGVRWNWAFSPGWLLASGVEASRLVDVARHSPLTVRATGVTASAALAVRF